MRTLLLACALGASWAHAQDYSKIATLLKQKKTTEALSTVQQRLEKSPRDPQLRFLLGVAQTDLGETDQAIETFTQLTQDYPELPEPYNNLAVLYAGQNQLERAQRALELAVRANPDYGVAHQNLGDIYAKLAAESYEKAVRLEPATAAYVNPKLVLVRQLLGAAQPKSAVPAASAAPASLKSASEAGSSPKK